MQNLLEFSKVLKFGLYLTIVFYIFWPPFHLSTIGTSFSDHLQMNYNDRNVASIQQFPRTSVSELMRQSYQLTGKKQPIRSQTMMNKNFTPKFLISVTVINSYFA